MTLKVVLEWRCRMVVYIRKARKVSIMTGLKMKDVLKWRHGKSQGPLYTHNVRLMLI